MGKIVSLREFARVHKMAVATVQHYVMKGIIEPKEIVVKGYDLSDCEKILAHRDGGDGRIKKPGLKAAKKKAK